VQLTRPRLAGAAVVFAAAFALRLPFASEYLWAWDSVLYARAIDDFDVASGRPHAPGYLFYILVARAATWLTGDPNGGLVLVSMVAGAATCAVGFVVGSRLFGLSVGVLAAAILVADPLLWHYSEVAYPYALLALLSAIVGGLLWWSRRGAPARLLAASLAFGIAGGFRQDVLLLLGPLWLWAIVGRGPRLMFTSVVAVAFGSLAWLVPTAALSGGLVRYVAVTASQLAGVSTLGGSDPQTVEQNLLMTLIGLRWQLHWALPLAPLGAWVLLRHHALRSTAWPLALWVVPAVVTYLAFHIGEWAYTLSVAVPLALLAAVGGGALVDAARPRAARAGVAVAMAGALVLNAHSFVLGEGRFSARAIDGHDDGLAIRFAAFRERFPPSETVIIAEGGYQHARYYLPEYRVFYVPPGARVTRRVLAVGPEVRRAMLFLGEVRAHPRTPVRSVALEGGLEIRYVSLGRGSRLVVQDRLVSVEND